MKRLLLAVMASWILAGCCMMTPPLLTNIFLDGDDLVTHKANIQVDKLEGREYRVNIK